MTRVSVKSTVRSAVIGMAAAAGALLTAAPAMAVPVFGIDTNGRLVSFDSATPGTFLTTTTITGAIGSAILGIDFRPATGQLYALGGNAQLYTINTSTGVATAVSGTALPITGSNFGFDFNPTVDRIRLVSDSGQNLRLNPDTGGVAATDTAYTYAGGGVTNISAVGYTNNFGGATTTTLYGIDYVLNTLAQISPNPNGGVITTVGALGFDVDADASFDIGQDGVAYLSTLNRFYTVNLTTGTATLVGTSQEGLRTIALPVTVVPEPTTWAIMFVGFGVMGGMMRRRARPATVAV